MVDRQLFAAAILIESHRTNPLLRIDWVASGDIARFAAIKSSGR